MPKKNRSALSQAAALIGRKGGRAKSASKAAAVRANGRKGGRPRKRRPRSPRVAAGWPAEPLRPWTVLVVARTLMEKTVIEANGFEHAIFPDCDQLAQRLGLPVVAYTSTAGTPPYTRYGSSDQSGMQAADRDDILDALTETRQALAERPPASVRDGASLRAWSTEQLRELRALLNRAEVALAAGEWPWNTAAPLSEAAIAYADGLIALDLDDDFDHSGFFYPPEEEHTDSAMKASPR